MSEWRDVVGYEGCYKVSDTGQVLSLPRKGSKGGLLSPAKHTYPTVHLYHLGEGAPGRTFHLHVLVAAAFIGPRPEGLETRHLNGDPFDNRVENLAYGTSSENGFDTVAHGRNPWANQTTCRRGHPYTPDNLLPHPDGGRHCRTCYNALKRQWHAANKEKVNASRRERHVANKEKLNARQRQLYAEKKGLSS